MLNKTALYQSHLDLNADMVNFSGFLMPVRYKTSIVEEHSAVRNKVGMFDTSHMGRYFLNGKDAKMFLIKLVPRDLSRLMDMRSGYTFILNEKGGFKDDVIISQISAESYMLVCNAGNKEKIWNWLVNLLKLFTKSDCRLEDRSEISSMIAVQGPEAFNVLENIFGTELIKARFRLQWIDYQGLQILFSTTGYTGENGGEIIIFADNETLVEKSEKMWKILLDQDVVPCGLGARDTLRLEAGYRLYGNDITEEILLTESGLNFKPFVDLSKSESFIGKEMVEKNLNQITRTFVGFKLLDKGIARKGFQIFVNNENVGEVLSGTQSPLTKESFGMALIYPKSSAVGEAVEIEIRGKRKSAEIVDFPIYDPEKFGMLRK